MIDYDTIVRIHQRVNECEYVTDLEKYGVPEHWTDITVAAGESGDCEDTMIGKALAFLRDGWPVRLLRFATYWTGPGQTGYHAVLLVDLPTDRGVVTYMLSNGLPYPLTVDQIPSAWTPHKYQIAGTYKWEFA